MTGSEEEFCFPVGSINWTYASFPLLPSRLNFKDRDKLSGVGTSGKEATGEQEPMRQESQLLNFIVYLLLV